MKKLEVMKAGHTLHTLLSDSFPVYGEHTVTFTCARVWNLNRREAYVAYVAGRKTEAETV